MKNAASRKIFISYRVQDTAGETGRLVDDDDVGVLVKDLEGHRLRFDGAGRWRGKLHENAIAGAYGQIRTCFALGDADVTVGDQLLDL